MAQGFNFEGIKYFFIVKYFNKSLAIPHFAVADINDINPTRLSMLGFKGIIFDKDNTLTAPYVNEIYPTIKKAFNKYKEIFDHNMVIMSNSAGTKDDKNYEDAKKNTKRFRNTCIKTW